MKEHFIKQFEFEFWSNNQILATLNTMNVQNERALTLFSHLLSSHSMWLSRVNKSPFTCTLFQERTLPECEQLMAENKAGWLLFLSNASNQLLETEIEF